ncbi:MAG: hypothetical protein IJP94_05780 [Clostridia bacterium]|nr:hypothetical protein [Clostridia bacterium]
MKFRAILNDKYDIEEAKQFKLKQWHRTVIFFLGVAAVLNLLAVLYVTGGKAIFFWDDATYWDISRRIVSGGMNEGGFWTNVYNSVALKDYNYIAALPSAAVMSIFGTSRLVYVLGLVNMYLFPSSIVIYQLAKKLSKAPKLAMAVTLVIMPCIAFLTFIGFVDVGGLLICLICFNVYYPKREEKVRFWRYPVIGLLLVAALLWRRYFAFFSVSFVTAMVADVALFKRKWYGLAAVVIVMGGILVLFFRDFVFYKLMGDYGNLYAGYKFELMTDFKLITRYFGLIFIIGLAVCSVFMGIKKKETKVVFLWLQIIVCLVMFLSTQTHGQQHLLLYVPSLILLTLITIKHITKEWMLISICALAALHTLFVYIPRPQPHNIQEIKSLALIPTFSMIPEQRTDTEEILALKQRLDGVVYEGDTLGVLASSFTLNEDILKNVEPSLGIKQTRDNYIVSLPQVDSRDRDLSPLYNVNYVLVAFPAQTHLAEGSQTVVTEAVKSFEVYADIATAYEEIYDCETVIDGMTIKLFHRVRAEDRADIAEFEERLYH